MKIYQVNHIISLNYFLSKNGASYLVPFHNRHEEFLILNINFKCPANIASVGRGFRVL